MANLGYGVLALLLASLFGVIAWRSTNPGIQMLSAAICMVFTLAGFLITWDWLAERVSERTAAIRDALAITPASKLAEAIANLEPWQMDALRRYAVEIDSIISPDAYPSYTIRAPHDQRVPLEFAAEFMELTEYPQLPAIRRWSDGSRERAWAQGLTDLLVMHGWATQAVGNQSARLVVPMSDIVTRLGL